MFVHFFQGSNFYFIQKLLNFWAALRSIHDSIEIPDVNQSCLRFLYRSHKHRIKLVFERFVVVSYFPTYLIKLIEARIVRQQTFPKEYHVFGRQLNLIDKVLKIVVTFNHLIYISVEECAVF